MNQRPEQSIKRGIANAFGSLGYLFCFLQWFWVIALYFSVIQSLTLLVVPVADEQVQQVPSFAFTPPNPLEITILVTITVIMVAITIYAFIRMPISIAKTSNKIVHKTTEAIVPVVIKSQHKKDTKKIRARITSRLVLTIKSLLIVIPLLLAVMSGLLEKPSLDYSIAMIIGGTLAGLSAVLFTIQYLLASLLRIKLVDLW